MGIYDREYVNSSRGMGGGYRDSRGGGGAGGFPSHPRGWSVTTWIIVINLLIHFVLIPFAPIFYNWGYLSVEKAFFKIEVWRLITFQFLHNPAGISHVLFNMMGMFFFAPIVEQHLGKKKFFAFYLMCGLSGGMLFVILNILGAFTPIQLLSDGFKSPLIGASAGVFGVIMACAYLAPDSKVMLFFLPISIAMRTVAYGYVAISLFMLLIGSANAGGEAAHIGGAIAGFYFIRYPGYLTDFFDVFGDSREPQRQKPKSKSKRSSYRHYNNTGSQGPTQDQIDKILEKVSQKGLASLTDKEKKILSAASKNDD